MWPIWKSSHGVNGQSGSTIKLLWVCAITRRNLSWYYFRYCYDAKPPKTECMVFMHCTNALCVLGYRRRVSQGSCVVTAELCMGSPTHQTTTFCFPPLKTPQVSVMLYVNLSSLNNRLFSCDVIVLILQCGMSISTILLLNNNNNMTRPAVSGLC